MAPGKLVLITAPFDQGDILRDFLDWHLHLGFDLILAIDHGSTDGSREILDEYAATGRLIWWPLPDRNIDNYSPGDVLSTAARDEYGADWIVHCDVDEFLCTSGADLRTILADAEERGASVLDIPRRAMTGRPIPEGKRATEVLTLRIDETYNPSHEEMVSGNIPTRFCFIGVQGHLAIRASAFEKYGPGAHTTTPRWGETASDERLYILTYPTRGFATLQQKVENVASFLALNPDLPPGWGWHWRRLVRQRAEGRLREAYDNEFVSDEEARRLIADGTCATDETVASWLRAKDAAATSKAKPSLIQRLFRR
jgi:hypothetical protein